MAAMEKLNQAWGDFRPAIVEQLDGIGWKHAVISPGAFVREKVDPRIATRFAPVVAACVAAAKEDLADLFEDEWSVDTNFAGSSESDNRLAAALDVLQGVGPLASGLFVGAAIPSVAVVSGTAMLGLVATSTISMPIVLGGLALAGTSVATGVVKTSAIRDKAIKRMIGRIDRHVSNALLDPDIDDRHPAVLARVLESYRTTALVAMGDS